MDIERGSLRAINRDDLVLVLEWRNLERIRKEMFTDHIISWDEHEAWFAGIPASGNHHCIFELNGCPVGVSSFTAIDPLNKHCSWGFYLGENPLPRGTGTLLGIYSMQYAFDVLGVHRVYSEVMASNQVSLNYHSKMGFSLEGVLREHIKKAGVFIDVVCYGQLAEEWATFQNILRDKLEKDY